MAPVNGYTITPHQRQNRRRERPGSRTRRSLTRRSILTHDYTEGLADALDTSVHLPSERTKPSPLLRHNFDKSWQRWKARQAAEEDESAQGIREMEVRREKLLQELESEQLRLFGGDVDDDELSRMGILYEDDEDVNELHSEVEIENLISCSVPIDSVLSEEEETAPLYIIRHRKPRHRFRSRRSASWRSLSLSLSMTPLGSDAEIARFLTTPEFVFTSPPRPIQHRQIDMQAISYSHLPSTGSIINFGAPIHSLPPAAPVSFPPAFESLPARLSLSSISTVASTIPSSISTNVAEDWTIIDPDPPNTSTTSSHSSTPSSEPETWILLSDDS